MSRLVGTAGDTAYAFSLQNATVTKKREKLNDRDHQSLSLRATGEELFGSQHHLALFCDVPQSGRYRVSIEMMQGPEQGAVELERLP